MVTIRLRTFIVALLVLWCSHAWAADVELDANQDGKLDDIYIPSSITRDSELSAGLAGKQNALGFIPENAANKGAANGYAGLGSDGKVPAGQLPESSGTDDQTATEVPATPWGSYTGTNVQVLMREVDTALRALVSGAALPSWMPSVGPTNGRQILQAVGGCSNTAYDTQTTCETNSGTWTTPTYQHTSVISGLINDTGSADDDLWSAAKITSELAGKQGSLGFTPENAANKGTANGYAGLGSDGKVPSSQLPTLGTTYSLPSLADAQAGSSTEPYVWSPQRVAQAIAALAPSGGLDGDSESFYEIDGGTSLASLTARPADGGSATASIITGTINGGTAL